MKIVRHPSCSCAACEYSFNYVTARVRRGTVNETERNIGATVWRGREQLHYLNPVPINEIFDRWAGKYERRRLRALRTQKALEENRDG